MAMLSIGTSQITGMTCNHCVRSVARALGESAGVDLVGVDLKSGRAIVKGKELNADLLVQVVEGLGYAARADFGPASETATAGRQLAEEIDRIFKTARRRSATEHPDDQARKNLREAIGHA